MSKITKMDEMFQEKIIMAAKGLVHREERGDAKEKIELAREVFVNIHKDYHEYLIAVVQKNEAEIDRIEGLHSAALEKYSETYYG